MGTECIDSCVCPPKFEDKPVHDIILLPVCPVSGSLLALFCGKSSE